MEDPKNLELSVEASKQLQEGISLVFSKWWALQIAVENEWGGPHSRDKALDFTSRVFNFFNQPNRREPLYIDDLEEMLDEGMDSFNTCADDGSIEQVAEQLMIMHEECLEGNYQSIQKLREVRAMPVPRVRQDENDSDEDDEGEEENLGNDEASSMMVDSLGSLSDHNPADIATTESRSQQMAEAEDGWVVVASKKGRGRKN